MIIYRLTNELFKSNTYILLNKQEKCIWLIDPGNAQAILEWMYVNKVHKINGILATHTHFDHIYGINELIDIYQDIFIYVSINGGLKGLKNSKINGSQYAEIPFEVQTEKIVEVYDGSKIDLWKGSTLLVIETPGHSNDSISFFIDNLLFTGDALIPNIKVVTKLRGGNIELAKKSVNRIMTEFGDNTVICPGHNEKCIIKKIRNFSYV